jgi:hypothetical protein
VDLTQVVEATGNGGAAPTVSGSICCFVSSRADPTRRFALGCQHVLARGKANACRPMPASRLQFAASGVSIGPLASWGAVQPGAQSFSMDAAIAEVESQERVENRFGGKIIRRSLLPGEDPSLGRYALWSTRRPGSGIRADFVGIKYRESLPYSCGAVMFKTLFQFSAATQNGDSGSPIVAADGTLIGMHIYGAVSSGAGGQQSFSYAIPAYELFQDDLFSVEIDLI